MPKHSAPHHSEPHHSEPHHSEPHHSEPHHSEPHHSEPHHSEPHHSEPHHSEPHHSEPHHSEPHHSEPHHSEPHHSGPHLPHPNLKHLSILKWLRVLNPESLIFQWVADSAWHAVKGGASNPDGFLMEIMQSAADHQFHFRITEHGNPIKASELTFKEAPKFAKILEELIVHLK